jgi:DNA-binding Xre family transcriptional regulator
MISDKEALETWDTIKNLFNYMLFESLDDLSLSQKQLADKTGISDSRLSKHRRKISPSKVQHIRQ